MKSASYNYNLIQNEGLLNRYLDLPKHIQYGIRRRMNEHRYKPLEAVEWGELTYRSKLIRNTKHPPGNRFHCEINNGWCKENNYNGLQGKAIRCKEAIARGQCPKGYMFIKKEK